MAPKANLHTSFVITLVLLVVLCFAPPSTAQPKVVSTPTPAPAPGPEFVNLTDLLSVAGPFRTFLNYLETMKVMQTLQDQANNTEQGLTLFVPEDKAFSSLKSPSLSNLTQDQIKSLCLFHALPRYYTLSDFKNLSGRNPVQTLAGGGGFGLNFTDNSGTVRVDSGWTQTKITSAVHAADPVAIYETDRVLLPEAIFGSDVPPAAAPAPAPEGHHGNNAPTADGPPSDVGSPGSTPKSSADGAVGSGGLGLVVSAFVAGIMMVIC